MDIEQAFEEVMEGPVPFYSSFSEAEDARHQEFFAELVQELFGPEDGQLTEPVGIQTVIEIVQQIASAAFMAGGHIAESRPRMVEMSSTTYEHFLTYLAERAGI